MTQHSPESALQTSYSPPVLAARKRTLAPITAPATLRERCVAQGVSVTIGVMKAPILAAWLLVVATPTYSAAQATSEDEMTRWKAEAQTVTIVRDDWGIAHIHGPTDASAVFGMIYAQAEDDFNRVE